MVLQSNGYGVAKHTDGDDVPCVIVMVIVMVMVMVMMVMVMVVVVVVMMMMMMAQHQFRRQSMEQSTRKGHRASLNGDGVGE
jgi:ABC-type bacteriocin/lantibiotic exporter with double-glycine peptidase domain